MYIIILLDLFHHLSVCSSSHSVLEVGFTLLKLVWTLAKVGTSLIRESNREWFVLQVTRIRILGILYVQVNLDLQMFKLWTICTY